jgi:hypothetical protein
MIALLILLTVISTNTIFTDDIVTVKQSEAVQVKSIKKLDKIPDSDPNQPINSNKNYQKAI